MKSKVGGRFTAVMFGIALLALVVMPACDSGGGNGTGPSGSCDILDGTWAVELTEQSHTCGWINTTGTDYFTFTIDEDTGEVEFGWWDELADPGEYFYIYRTPFTCDAEGFSIINPPTPEPNGGCATVTQFVLTGIFDSDSIFHGTISQRSVSVPSGCGYECDDTYSITATRL